MRDYTTKLYKELVEEIDDEILQRFMEDEKSFIAGITNIKYHTVVDLGAGYGRVVPYLSGISKDVIAIEINPDMHSELNNRASSSSNVTAIQGNFLKLTDILPKSVTEPIFLILQNSLGTIEGGDYKDTLASVIKAAQLHNGQLVLSLLKQPSLASWGVNMYAKIKEMVGEVDMSKSNFDKGIFVSTTGYTSKWWTDEEIAQFRKLGAVVREQQAPAYQFLQIKLT